MHRRLRVCCELPPRHSRGADSRRSTEAPASRAISAAQRAALPPPITRTSCTGRTLACSGPGFGGSLRLGPRVAHDLRPLGGLAADERAELGGCHVAGLHTLVGE